MLVRAGMMVLQQLSGINCILFFSADILAAAGLGSDAAAAAVSLGIAQLVGTALSLQAVSGGGGVVC